GRVAVGREAAGDGSGAAGGRRGQRRAGRRPRDDAVRAGGHGRARLEQRGLVRGLAGERRDLHGDERGGEGGEPGVHRGGPGGREADSSPPAGRGLERAAQRAAAASRPTRRSTSARPGGPTTYTNSVLRSAPSRPTFTPCGL